ncbi:16S rRNA (cytidine(1402)-2'-O)-methyltransferase [Buchnera aphidicola (Mollitrichosiphum nigrofasciatum)]|uniref:16S rRNA (cytidine(1402)-2'-O)-methyltransferase n=1 Tax=Buchnera aphidicola TaxID=9 RepID=UPI0031B81E33
MQFLKKKKTAIVSNAGTPLINDPGYNLVKLCYIYNILIIPLPGACAAITALCASGIPANKFCYEGFLPNTKKKRQKILKNLKKEKRTIILNESPHRILKCMDDIKNILGKKRIITIAKELTKKKEKIKRDTVSNIILWFKKKKKNKKGEITIIIKGYKNKKKEKINIKILETFKILTKYFKFKKAVKITAKIHNLKKNFLYKKLLKK